MSPPEGWVGRINPPYTKEDDTLLTEMWNAGELARDIGKRLGRTKNSVIGRAGRLGLPKKMYHNNSVLIPAQPGVRQNGPRRKNTPINPNPYRHRKSTHIWGSGTRGVKAPAVVSIVEPTSITNKPLTERGAHECACIVSDLDAPDRPPIPLVCGEVTQPGSSYCPYHHSRFWMSLEDARKRRRS